MAKWADFLISSVRYNEKPKNIKMVKLHEDKGDTVGGASETTRSEVIRLIKNGKTVCTIYKGDDGKWAKGEPVKIIKVNGDEFIKTVSDSEEVDNLENLPTF